MPGSISPHTDFMVKCPQCPIRLGFQVSNLIGQNLSNLRKSNFQKNQMFNKLNRLYGSCSKILIHYFTI